jgi:hypothetical protein
MKHSGRFASIEANKSILIWDEFQRYRIDAIAQAGWGRAVWKHMTLMTAALGADGLNAAHAIGIVLNQAHMNWIDGRIKARPTGAGLKFGLGPKQGQAAQAAAIGSRLFLIEQAAAKRGLGAMMQ